MYRCHWKYYLQIWGLSKAWFFACWYLTYFKHFRLGAVKMGVAILVTGLSNWLYLSQEGTDWINGFFKRCYKFRKTWSCFNNSWMGVVKNEHGYSCYGTLLLAVSQNELMKWADLLHADNNARIFDYPVTLTQQLWLSNKGVFCKWTCFSWNLKNQWCHRLRIKHFLNSNKLTWGLFTQKDVYLASAEYKRSKSLFKRNIKVIIKRSKVPVTWMFYFSFCYLKGKCC